MREETNMINVLIKDGNRTVNWDCYPDRTIWDILKEFQFRPVIGSVKVGGEEIPQGRIGGMKLSDCCQEISPDGKQMRVVITLKSVPEKKPAVKKEQVREVSADVR